MTVDEKLAETDYNLHKIRHLPMMTSEFSFELSNFLNSSLSIFWHLLEDHNVSYGLGLDYIDPEGFKEKAKSVNNNTALNFIRWYQDEFNKITQNKEYGFLTDKRRQNVHKRNVMPQTFRITDHTSRTFSAGTTTTIPINFDNAEAYFPDNPKQNVRLVCVRFFDRIKKFVSDTHSSYPT